MPSCSLEEAYQKLWAAIENGTVSEEFFDLREDARHFLPQTLDNVLMQHAGALLLEVHQEWEEVGERLGVSEDKLFESFMRVQKRK